MIEIIKEKRLIPVITINDSNKTAGLANALEEAGLPIAEITLRTPEGINAIREFSKNSKCFVGVGSLKNGEELKTAVEVGAKFAVSAGFSPSVAQVASEIGIPYFPGVATPTEIMQALDFNLKILKFFPAETLGGTAAIKAISAPFPDISFIPTGGITLENAKAYLDIKSVVAVGGSWLVNPELINKGDFSSIFNLTKEALEELNNGNS